MLIRHIFVIKKQFLHCHCNCPPGPVGPQGPAGPQVVPGGVLNFADLLVFLKTNQAVVLTLLELALAHLVWV